MKKRKPRIPGTANLLDEMVAVGVGKIIGQKVEGSKVVPVYDAVPPEHWPPEGRAFMGVTEEELPALIAKYGQAARERIHGQWN